MRMFATIMQTIAFALSIVLSRLLLTDTYKLMAMILHACTCDKKLMLLWQIINIYKNSFGMEWGPLDAKLTKIIQY